MQLQPATATADDAADDPRQPANAPIAAAADETEVDLRQRAIARITASRGRLRAHWIPEPVARVRGHRAGGLTRRVRAWWRRWRSQVADTPVTGLALSAVESWWQRNPWREAGEAVADEVQHAVSPWVRRHPVLAVALAAAGGGALAAAKPWAWPFVAQQIKPMPRRLARWALKQLSQAPLQSLILGVLVAGGTAAAVAPATPAAPEPAPEPSAPIPPEGGLHDSR